MCKWSDCNEGTGSFAKKYCGDVHKKGTCNYKNAKSKTKKYHKEYYRTENNMKSGEANARKQRDEKLRNQGYDNRETCQSWMGE